MSTWQWYTVAKRYTLCPLIEMCMCILEDKQSEDFDDLDGNDSLLSDNDTNESDCLLDLTMEYSQ
jgi:hypothetical protein